MKIIKLKQLKSYLYRDSDECRFCLRTSKPSLFYIKVQEKVPRKYKSGIRITTVTQNIKISWQAYVGLAAQVANLNFTDDNWRNPRNPYNFIEDTLSWKDRYSEELQQYKDFLFND